MSCDIIGGRELSCKDSVGGLHSIYLINYNDVDFTGKAVYGTGDNTDQITAVDTNGTTFSIYKFELKNSANTFETAINSSRDTGTTFFESTLSITLPKQDVKSHKNIKLIAYGRPRIIVHARGDQFFLMGLDQGCDVSAGTATSGGELGSFSGYQLTFTSQEEIMPNFLNCSTQLEMKTLLENGATGTGVCNIVTT